MSRSQPAPPCRPSPGRIALSGLIGSTMVVASASIAAPALAATATVSTKADLAAQVAAAPAGTTPTEITLGAPLTSTDPAHDTIRTPDDSTITLDLHGEQLALQQLTVGDGATLLVTDTSGRFSRDTFSVNLIVSQRTPPSGTPQVTGIAIESEATLHLDAVHVYAAGSGSVAGIGSPATVTTDPGRLEVTGGASVNASGGTGASGIGGAEGAAAVGVSVTDSSVTALGGSGGAGIGSGRSGTAFGGLSTDSGPRALAPEGDYRFEPTSVDAYGGAGAAGIGGGLHASGGDVVLNGNTRVTASGRATDSGSPSAIGSGQDPAAPAGADVFGSLQVGETTSLLIPADSSLIVPEHAVMRNDGRIALRGRASGAGTIINAGSIDVADGYGYDPSVSRSTEVDPGSRVTVAHVTGHNYAVRLDPNTGTSTGYETAHVFTSYLRTDALPAPTPPQAGQALLQWNTRADGSGDDVDLSSLADLTGGISHDGNPVPLTIYARYGFDPVFTGDTMPAAGLGMPYDQPAPVSGDGIDGYAVSTFDEDGEESPGLPAGLSLNEETGRITGVPTEAGDFRFTLIAYTRRLSVSKELTVSIAGAPAIATDSLPGGQQDVPYSTQLTATGRGTIAWDVPAGSSLPQGLALSRAGVLSGTPTGSGRSTFSVRAFNEYGPAVRTFTLDTAAAAAAATAPAAGSATAPVATTGPGASAAPSAAAAPAPAPAAVPAPAAAPATSAPAAAEPTATRPAPAPAAPVLATVPRTVVRFGHRLDLAVAASSTVAVRWSVSGDLPKGISFDRVTGAFSGVAAEVGTFDSTVTATSSAGSASTPVRLVVPEIQELIDAKPVPAVAVGAHTVPVRVSGFKKGERWRVLVNGAVVKSGTMKRAGVLKTSVALKGAQKDTTHRIVVTTSRKVTDPAKSAATTFTVTTLAAKKQLQAGSASAGRGLVAVKVAKLGAGERVTVTEKTKVVARGVADAAGRFSFVSKKLAKGVHRLVFRGATSTRSDTLTVKPGSR